MSGVSAAFSHFAILIGIDAYQTKPLKSCVTDINSVRTFLEASTTPIHIQFLAAPVGDNNQRSSGSEYSDVRPTYDRVIAAFDKVCSLATCGDSVYVHYSGHGTHAEPDYDDEFSNHSSGDLALVLLDEGSETPERYLWGSELADLLRTIVGIGLQLTLVLDCCFASTVYRYNDPEVRFIAYDRDIGIRSAAASRDGQTAVLSNAPGCRSTRDLSMAPSWLIDPDKYAIIAACAPHKTAKEFKLKNGQYCGALSYFLLSVLRRCGTLSRTHKDIYDHLSAVFQKSWPQQHPVFYGNKYQAFFGCAESNVDVTAITVIERQDGQYDLQAGQAHGMRSGDELAMSFLDTSSLSQKSLRARIVCVRPLTSTLQLLLDRVPQTFQAEGTAKLITRLSLCEYPIFIASNVPHRKELRALMRGRSMTVHEDEANHDDEVTVSVRIADGTHDKYEILEGSGEMLYGVVDQTSYSQSSICDAIEHLAKFKVVKGLTRESPESSFSQLFTANIFSPSGDRYDSALPIKVVHDEHVKFMFELSIENKTTQELYVFVYNLGPFWQIQNVLRASYEVIVPQNPAMKYSAFFRKKLKTVVPPDLGDNTRYFRDIIKVYVTTQPTSFDMLELPKLGDYATQPVTGSGGRFGSDNNSFEDWASVNFEIHTYLR